jgi:hypothetical protein
MGTGTPETADRGPADERGDGTTDRDDTADGDRFATDRHRPTPTSGALAAVAGVLAVGTVLGGVATVGAVAVVAEGTVALGAATLLLGRARPPALAVGTFLAGAGALLLSGGTAVATAGAPPAAGLSAALVAGGVLVLVPVLFGAPPARLAAGVGLAGAVALAAGGLAVAATVRGNPVAAASLAGWLGAAVPAALAPAAPLVEAGAAVGVAWLWARRAVTDGFASPAGRVAAARPWLRRGALGLFGAALLAPELPGLASAARDGATHATLGGLVAVAVGGYAATVLLGNMGGATPRRPAGWAGAALGAVAVLGVTLAVPSAVGIGTRALVGAVPGFVTVAGFLTDAAGSAGAVRGVVTPLVLLTAVGPPFVLLAALTAAERAALLRGPRGLAGVAAGLLAAGALVSAVLTRDPARTIAAVALSVLVWDLVAFGLSLAELVDDGGRQSGTVRNERTGTTGLGRITGAPAVERGHATTSLAVAGLAVTAGVGFDSVAGGAGPAGTGAAVVLLLGATVAGLLALRGRL